VKGSGMSIFKDEINLITADFSITPGIVAISSDFEMNEDKPHSGDINTLYIYSENPVAEDLRNEIARRYCHNFLTGKCPDEIIDFWTLKTSGKELELRFRSPMWLMGELRSILVNYEAKAGYTTCEWHKLMNSYALFDPIEWFEDLKESSDVPYPEGLKTAILRKNLYLLKGCRHWGYSRLKRALHRADIAEVNITISDMLCSYFDIIFAFNNVTHPGRKNMIENAKVYCGKLPHNFEEDVKELILSVSWMSGIITERAKILLDRLEEMLKGDAEK
jgi:hypothetical protein